MSLDIWIPKQPDAPIPTKAAERMSLVSKHTSWIMVRPALQLLTHDAELSNLWDYYEMQIFKGKIRRDLIPARECNGRCKRINFVYPSTVVFRHPKEVEFVIRLVDLEYRYCKGCAILIPKSQILELEQIRESRKERSKRKPPRTEAMPIKCPCCFMKTANAKVLIRKTKMGRQLFEDEGY